MSKAFLFIESADFTVRVKSYFGSDEVYAQFQSELASNPEKGPIVSGVSPLRKIRWGDRRRGMGKRGGLRVIYIHIPDLSVLFMLDVYDKDEADDLSSSVKTELKALANVLVNELRERNQRGQL